MTTSGKRGQTFRLQCGLVQVSRIFSGNRGLEATKQSPSGRREKETWQDISGARRGRGHKDDRVQSFKPRADGEIVSDLGRVHPLFVFKEKTEVRARC